MAESVDTVTEAIQYLKGIGYDYNFTLGDACLCHRDEDGEMVEIEAPRMEHSFRFEGTSDPGDEMIVVAVVDAEGRKGVVASAYGSSADPQNARFLRSLVDDR